MGSLVFPSRLSGPSSPSRHESPKFFLANPVLRRFPSVHHQHRNFESVLRFERGIAGDVDFFERQRDRASDGMHHRFHVVAKVTARARVDCERDHRRRR